MVRVGEILKRQSEDKTLQIYTTSRPQGRRVLHERSTAAIKRWQNFVFGAEREVQ